MAEVTGTLKDFGLDPIAGLTPEILFEPSGPAIGVGGVLLATEPVRVTPAANGSWTAYLTPTDELLPFGTHYRVFVKWLDGETYRRVDSPNWKLSVPAGGGTITDLIRLPFGPGLSVTSPTPPPLWVGLGASWLQLDPNDPDNPDNPANTGDYHELENI